MNLPEKKDPRYFLITFFNEEEQATHNYKRLKQSINERGFYGINSDNRLFKIYTPEIALIFSKTTLKVENMETQTETLINTFDFLKTYIEAYKEGEQYFENEFKLLVNGMYSENAKYYVKDIHDNFFHVQHEPSKEGWSYVKNCYPFILNHEGIKKFGYYSGIVSKVEEQVKKYYQIFKTFDVCEHNEQPELTIKPKPESLSDLITNKNSVAIVEAIKIQYKNIKGKRLKLLLIAFQELELLPKERIASKFHKCCKNEFDWNVSSYNAMHSYNYNFRTDNIDKEEMKNFILKYTK
jgi:hypothetical protein